jgi:SPP1 family predicted phage head-tail adaptor
MAGRGDLRERVRLQNPPAEDDGSGGQIGGWTDVAEIWARVWAIGGDEEAETAIVTGITRYRVKIVRRAVTSGQRFVWQGMALNIRNVLPDERREYTTLLCEAVPL